MRTSIIVLLAGAIVCTSSTFASADDTTSVAPSPPPPLSPPSIEDRGHVIFDRVLSYGVASGPLGGFGFGGIAGYSSNSTDGTLGTAIDGTPARSSMRSAYVWLAPSLDYVFAKRLTIGATLALTNMHQRYSSGSGATGGSTQIDTFSVAVAPRVGYLRALTDDIALWTRVGFGATESLSGSLESSFGWQLEADSLLVFRAGRHLIATLGPTLRYGHTTTHAVVGAGWPDGTSDGFSVGGRASLGLIF